MRTNTPKMKSFLYLLFSPLNNDGWKLRLINLINFRLTVATIQYGIRCGYTDCFTGGDRTYKLPPQQNAHARTLCQATA